MKTILLKLSGELLAHCSSQSGDEQELTEKLNHITSQLLELQKTHRIALVIGGGNFFRARQARTSLALRQPVADAVGMLATVMNALMLQEFFTHHNLSSVVLSALDVPALTLPINQTTIDAAWQHQKLIIFAGGSGNPYFTTDTTAVIRALQINAHEVWKGTNVDYIYEDDPRSNPLCKPITTISTTDFLNKQLRIMDSTAIMLAHEHNLTIRIFNANTPNALHNVANNASFGSTIFKKQL